MYNSQKTRRTTTISTLAWILQITLKISWECQALRPTLMSLTTMLSSLLHNAVWLHLSIPAREIILTSNNRSACHTLWVQLNFNSRIHHLLGTSTCIARMRSDTSSTCHKVRNELIQPSFFSPCNTTPLLLAPLYLHLELSTYKLSDPKSLGRQILQLRTCLTSLTIHTTPPNMCICKDPTMTILLRIICHLYHSTITRMILIEQLSDCTHME